MIQPTEHQIGIIREILEKSVDELISNDNDIFNIDIEMPQQISDDARLLNRELHETTINHRLAFYIENNIQNTEFNDYNVDIEYNRYYGNLKILNTIRGQLSVRPDILVHSRINNQVEVQHLLVIEAKKGDISLHDINKIKGFISDPNYNYLFGLTISYCRSETHVLVDLYYFDGENIITTNVNRIK